MGENQKDQPEAKGSTSIQRKDISKWLMQALVWISVSVFIVFVIFTMLRGPLENYRQPENKIDETDLVLSFIQTVTVLIGIAVGLTAVYGLRSFQEIRQKQENALKELSKIHNEIIEKAQAEVVLRIDDAIKAMYESSRIIQQAEQEMRQENYPESYSFARNLLEQNPDNVAALHMAGWLEINHIKGKLDLGIEHLGRLNVLVPDWPSAKAAYGLAMRRKGSEYAKKNEHEKMRRCFAQAEKEYREALEANFYLTDFNSESYWGSLGGLLRDRGDIDDSIEAYENALKVTPRSSYPKGNVAALRFQKGQLEQALKAFELAKKFAEDELRTARGNYYLMMDIAMACTILGKNDVNMFQEGTSILNSAINLDVGPSQLQISQGGWLHLYKHCPEDADWKDVKHHLSEALKIMEKAIKELEAREKGS